MQFLPVFFAVKDEPCLVVGGGSVASRKVALLRRAGARVRLVAPEVIAEFEDLAAAGQIELMRRPFRAEDLDGVRLVIAATNDETVNRQVWERSNQNNVPVNVVDSPALCTFILPSILDRSPLLIAVSTGGTSPVLARQLRSRLETLIPSAYGRLASMIEAYRARVKVRLPDGRSRMRFWEAMLEGPMTEMIFAGLCTAPQRTLSGR